MKINDYTIVSTQFVGVCLSVILMIIGGGIYLYSFAFQPIDLDRPLAMGFSWGLLVSGILLLIGMQLVRVFMIFCLFLKSKQKVLSIVSFTILVILSISFVVKFLLT